MTDTNATEPDHYADLLGMNLWELVKPLRFIEGNILKYIWRAGLKEGVDATEDYSKALAYLEKLDTTRLVILPKDYFQQIPFMELIGIMHGWTYTKPKLGKVKSACLFYFFQMLAMNSGLTSPELITGKDSYEYLKKALHYAIDHPSTH
jgi:hypothetical protein